MKNTLTIDGVRAVISFDPDTELFRGEFIGLNGGADFYAADIAGLKREGAISLKVFREMCAEEGIAPMRSFSGKFNVRIPPALHADAASAAAAAGKSLNQWVADSLAVAAMA